MSKVKVSPGLRKVIQGIRRRYNSCKRELGFKRPYEDLSWAQKTKVRACVMARRRKKGL
jgi:hypothetical protein